MAPKKIVPKGTDDIIELTDIVEKGKLPQEDAGASLTDASFEDELDSMLADVPELSAAAKEVAASPGSGAAGRPAPVAAPAAAVDSDELADLDSLLEDLEDDLTATAPPAPKAAPTAPAEEVLLDVDDLLAEAGAADQADFAPPAASAGPVGDDTAVDDFLAEFADLDASAPVGGEGAAPVSIDGATVDADDLLAELQGAMEPEVEEDDLLAELKSVMGDAAPGKAAAPEVAAPAADSFEAAMAAASPESEPVNAEVSAPEAASVDVDPFEAAMAATPPEPEAVTPEAPAPEADPFEAAMAAQAPSGEDLAAMVAAAQEEKAAATAAPKAPAEDDALAPEELQQLDALLDDILQPGAAAAVIEADGVMPDEEAAAEVELAPQAAVAQEDVFEPVETVAAAPAAPVDTAALASELLAEDSPLLTAVRDLVQQEMEARMAALEERLTQNLDKAAAQAAAQIIREEIAALAQDLVE